MDDYTALVKKILDTIFQASQITNYNIDIQEAIDDHKISINVDLNPASIFIGKGGDVLDAFEVLISAILQRATNTHWFVEFDINNYRTEKNYILKEIAKKAAHRVLVLKTPVRLEPMSSRERRIIHSEIALYPDLISESEGSEPRRYVVIKYREG